MIRTSTRTALLSSIALLSLAGQGALAQTIVGGGASLPSQDYAGSNVKTNPTPGPLSKTVQSELQQNSTPFLYYYASSGRGQTAFSTDNAGAFQFPGVTSGLVDYAASDAFLAPSSSTSVVNGFTFTTVAGIPGTTADYPLRKSQDGALIQIPMLSVGIAVPAGPTQVKANGAVNLTDDDLCGIFSGTVRNYSGTSASGVLSGPIDVYYRADSSGTSFLFTNHLKAVCTVANSSQAFVSALASTAPTTKFATLFAGYTTVGSNTFVPVNTYNSNSNGLSSGQVGSEAVATAAAGTVTKAGSGIVGVKADSAAVAYISPDFTLASNNGKSNATPAVAVTASDNSTQLNRTGFIDTGALAVPTVNGVAETTTNVKSALSTAKIPSGSANNPLNWVPSVPKPAKGYPIVGYTTWELAQCYSSPTIASGLITFLTNHFKPTSGIALTQAYTGFGDVPAPQAKVITSTFLTGGALGISVAGGNATNATCGSATGR